MIEKLSCEESNYLFYIIVVWAVIAKNALRNCYGFSLNQQVFGKNPTFSSTLINKIPAFEGKSSGELIASHLNAMHTGHKVFIEAESSGKLRKAIEAKTRNSAGLIYQPGDTVCFKRENSNLWKGSGIVLDRKNKKILVKYVGTYVIVYICENISLVCSVFII